MFVRSKQLDQLKNSISDSTIKVVYGVRRGGKTTLLEQLRSYLKRQRVPSARILIYDFDHPANAQQDPTQLFQQIKKRLTRDQVTYLFLDELETVPNYQLLVQKLVHLPRVDLYITSSAVSIQRLASQFPCQMVYLGPLRFQEFLTYHQLSANLSSLYHYLNTGGFPFAQEIRNFTAARNYFEGVINTIILNGFSQRNTLCNAGLVQQLAGPLLSQPCWGIDQRFSDSCQLAGRQRECFQQDPCRLPRFPSTGLPLFPLPGTQPENRHDQADQRSVFSN